MKCLMILFSIVALLWKGTFSCLTFFFVLMGMKIESNASSFSEKDGFVREPLLNQKSRVNTTSQIAIVGAKVYPIESLDYELLWDSKMEKLLLKHSFCPMSCWIILVHRDILVLQTCVGRGKKYFATKA